MYRKKAIGNFHALYERWKAGHANLERFLDSLLDRIRSVVCPLRVVELAAVSRNLHELRDYLQERFFLEQQVGHLLTVARHKATTELEAMLLRAEREHETFLARLQELIDQIENIKFQSWEGFVYDLSLFADAIEMREEQELESIAWLQPSPEEDWQPPVPLEADEALRGA